MKIILLLFLLISGLSINLSAQSDRSKSKADKNKSNNSAEKTSGANTFKKGQVDLNIGFGFGRNRYYYGSIYTRATPPISISLDYGITSNISVGGFFAFTRTRWESSGNYWNNGNNYAYTDTYTWSYYTVGARAAFHLAEFIEVDNLDVYFGIMAGNNFAKFKYSTDNNSGGRTYVNNYNNGGRIFFSFYAGARYMFTEKIGIFGEFGYGLTYGNIGLNIKL